MGYVENGQRYCKANNNVTYCEAVQLMYTIMSKCSNTTVSSSVVNKWTNIMTAKNIPSWAYNAVAYGLENEILSQNDISIFMTSSSSQNNAKREDIAVIFGKALGKVYNTSLNPTLNYLDANEISKTSVKQIIYFYPLSECLHFWRRLCDRYTHEKEICGPVSLDR